jgi:hypothetical protein
MKTQDTFKELKSKAYDEAIRFMIPSEKVLSLSYYDMKKPAFIPALADIIVSQIKERDDNAKLIDWNYGDYSLFSLEIIRNYDTYEDELLYRDWKDEKGNQITTDEGRRVTKKEAKKLIIGELNKVAQIMAEDANKEA